MIKFVIYGTQRTGSTILLSLIDSHPEILCIGEAFHRQGHLVNHGNLSYNEYIKKSFSKKVCNFFKMNYPVEKYLNYIYDLEGFKAIGFKLLVYQEKKYLKLNKYFKENDIKIIRMKRKNLLKKYISLTLARQRKMYKSNKPLENVKIYIKPKNILKELKKLEEEENILDERTLHLKKIEIEYEDLKNNIKNECQKVLSFLSVEKNTNLKSPLIKMTPDKIENVISNYDEIFNVLKDTKYISYLQ